MRRYCPAGESGRIAPAGEMWSVVTLSPTITKQRAPAKSSTGRGSRDMFSKYGGRRTYVEPGSHAKRSPSGIGSSRHAGSPVNTSEYVRVNISPRTAREIVSWISWAFGQRSRK